MLKKGINVVVGLPASGKTTLVNKLDKKGYSVYHTDDYKHYGWARQVEELLNDIFADENPNKLIEGIAAFRLLRHRGGVRTLKANHIILVECDVRVRIERYADDPQREGKNATAMDRRLTSDWEEYIEQYHDDRVTTVEVYDTSRGNE